MKISRMSEKGQRELLDDIYLGLKDYFDSNPEAMKDFLERFVDLLDEFSAEDFFGTEGWEHAFGIE